MNIRVRRTGLWSALACTAVLAGATAVAGESPAPAGLEKVEVKHIDAVYRLPGVNWAGYTKVLIAPASVSFSKSWDPRDYGAFGLSAADVDRMRTELATMAQDTFARVLAEGGYTVVTAPGEGVLAVRPDIVNLYINAPDPMEPGRSRTYVLNTGQMTLALELSDSITGTVLATARDRKRGTEHPWLTIANRVVNRGEAQLALTAWAKQLEKNLEAARKGP